MIETRDYVFFENIENTSIPTDPAEQKKEANWYLPQTTTTHNVQAQLGVSIFLPFSFEYRLPR